MKHSYFGTCLVGGHHPLDSPLVRECPVLQRQGRLHRRAILASKTHEISPVATTLQGTPEEAMFSPDIPVTSNTVNRDGRAGRSGRPRVPAVEQRRKAKERGRAYRQRHRVSGEAHDCQMKGSGWSRGTVAGL